MRGGKRAGAGRKPVAAPTVTRQTRVSLPPELYIKFKKLGGRKWLIKRLMAVKISKA